MNADTFIYRMERWSQVMGEHPEVLRQWAAQEAFIDGMESVQRKQLDALAEAYKPRGKA